MQQPVNKIPSSGRKWKLLLFIIILLIFVGGGILLLVANRKILVTQLPEINKQEKQLEKGLIITTDKVEYKYNQYEPISMKITLHNNLNESIFAYTNGTPVRCYYLENLERKTTEGNWEKLDIFGNNPELFLSSAI